jgi:hypothetical protein
MKPLFLNHPASPAASNAEPEIPQRAGPDLPLVRLRILPALPQPGIGLEDFKRELDRCFDMMELDSAFYEWFPQLRGSFDEQFKALDYTNTRRDELLTRCDPPGKRGGVDRGTGLPDAAVTKP